MSRDSKHTSPGSLYIICDICGRKIRQRDAVLITNKYNTHYGLVVCKNDADKTNPQAIPYSIRETQELNPKMLRSEAADTYLVNENDNRVPSAPQNLMALTHPINSTVVLEWQGPLDNGSSMIIGYKIERADPQDGPYTTLETNTNAPGTYYEDTTADLSTYYSYRVSAINSFGTGAVSNTAYFPYQHDILESGYSYLTTGDDFVLQTGDGENLVVLG